MDTKNAKTRDSNTSREADSTVQDHLTIGHSAALCHVSTMLTGRCPHLAALGGMCASRVLRTSEGSRALQNLARVDKLLPDDDSPLPFNASYPLQALLIDDAQSASESPSLANDVQGTAEAWSLLMADPVLLDGQDINRWSRRLVSALLIRCRHCNLACAGYLEVAAHSSGLSEMVLPLALLHIACAPTQV